MKKIIILALVAIAAIGLWHWKKPAAGAPKADPTATTVGGSFHPDPSNATYVVEGQAVPLSGGKAQIREDSGPYSDTLYLVETKLLEQAAYGDLNGDGKEDAVVLLAQSGGGKGTFVYAAAFVSGPVGYKGTNAIFLGDRIAPQSVSLSGTVATVKYLDRKPDEPFTAEPTISVTKRFVYENGGFAEK